MTAQLSFVAPPRSSDSFPASVARMLARLAELTPFSFLCVDVDADSVVGRTDDGMLVLLPNNARRRLHAVTGVETIAESAGIAFHAFPLPGTDSRRFVAVCYTLSAGVSCPQDAVIAAAEQNWSENRLRDWENRQVQCQPQLARNILCLALQQLGHSDLQSMWDTELEHLGIELEHTYEEISLLHTLTRNLQISRDPIDLVELCLDRMQSLIASEGHLICLSQRGGNTAWLTTGRVPLNENGIQRLAERYANHNWSKPLVKNHIQSTAWGAEFPGLGNFVMVPIAEGQHRFGWILSCNLEQGREFGTVEGSLLNSVATILGTHIRNIDLYRQHGELQLSFVRSMVSTLEARDSYTRGHSDRVALVARRLAEEIGLAAAECYDIYVSGLLHDIGKIGVDDQILRKPGRLTEEEFRQIQQHPVIGFEILKDLTNLRKILPGVRSHHEAYDGSGYPDGLAGEDIPLMARVLAVADAYDAMGSSRPYRHGMPLEKIEDILRGGSGIQWDPEIIDAYFRVRDDVARICYEYSPEHGDLLDGLPQVE